MRSSKNRMLPALLAVLALSACATPPSAETQSKVTAAISTACTVANVGSAAFDAYVAAKPGRIDQKGLDWKKGVMATLRPICANPAAVADPTQALTVVMQIGFALSDFIAGVDKAPVP